MAAIRYVTNGTYLAQMREMEANAVSEALKPLQAQAKALADRYEEAVEKVKATEDATLHDLCARHLVEMAADVIMLHLLLYNATADAALFETSAKVYARHAAMEVAKHHAFVMGLQPADLADYVVE